MGKCLVLLDEKFPFGKDETFLETEIKYYTCFDSIFICPCSERKYSASREIKNQKFTIIETSDKFFFNKLMKLWRYFLAIFHRDVIIEMIRLTAAGKFNLLNVKELLSFVSVGDKKFREIKKEFKRRKIDKDCEIIFYSYWMHFHAYVAIRLKKIYPKSRAVSRCHGFDLYEYRNPNNYIPLRPYILKNLDIIYCISDNGKKYLETKWPDIRSEIVVSRLGTMDCEIGQVDISRKPFKIVSCSWLSPVKRVNRIIQVLSQIFDIEIEWTHFGDGESFEEIRNRSIRSLPNNVSSKLLGALTNQEVQKYYMENDYHLFLNVSESEGIPVSIMEAISFGIPVVATDVGGVNEIVKHEYNGFLLDRDFTDKDLIKYIRGLYEMPANKYLRLRENARKLWENNYNADVNFRDFVSTLSCVSNLHRG